MSVLLAWGYFFGSEPPAETPEVAETRGADTTPAERSLEGTAEDRPASSADEPERLPAEAEEGGAEEGSTGRAGETVIAAEREETSVIQTDTAVVEISNRGGQLVSYRLKDHESADGGELDLVRRRSEGAYPFALVDRLGNSLPVNDALFAVSRDDKAGSEVVNLQYRGPEGTVRKSFHFEDNGLFDVEIEADGLGETWGVLIGPGLRNPAQEETEAKFAVRSLVYRSGGEFQRENAKKATETVRLDGAGVSWAGLDDNYFLSAVLPTTPLDEVVYRPFGIEYAGEEGSEGRGAGRFVPLSPTGELTEAEEGMPREYALVLVPEGKRFVAGSYWGAKQYQRLESIPGGLSETVDLGMFRVLAIPLMSALRWIHDNVVSNYGWAIVLMTVGIKLVLLPLTHKSMVSMRKMQELNPKMQAIRQKYAGKLKDKSGKPNLEAQQKMNAEIMGLYKEEGVNPAGGCLPMLLQIPVFFAFYKLLYTSVELRHAAWIPGVEDLAAPEPVLAIIMGATQFLQQRMMPSTGNEMQRRIMMFMPVVFTILFLGFPSGLVLYWLTNNTLSIIQQAIYNRLRPQPAQAQGGNPPGKRGGKPKAESI